MTLQQIKYVLEISKCGAISKAAQELFVAQPYLSSTLKELENELNIKIFSRTRKGVILTPDGKEFLSYAKPLLDQEEKILEMYSKNTIKPIFRFNISTQRYPFIIKAFFEYFEEHKPDKYEIHLREVNMHCVINDVFNKKSDIGIIFISNQTEKFMKKYLASKNIEFNEIICVSPCVFFRNTHPMASKDSVTLEEMSIYPYASFESETATSIDFSEEALLQNFSSTKKNFYVVDRGTMINTLTHTDAFSIGTGILSKGYAGQDLVSKPITGHGKEVSIGWIRNMGQDIPESIYIFIEKIKEVLHNTKS